MPLEDRTLRGRTLFITGASRGIGRAIALRAAADGANIVVAAKTAEPHPVLPRTIHTVAEEIEAAGGRALPVQVDIRFDEQIEQAVAKAVDAFSGIDILVNNASAISLTDTASTPMKRYDLMFDVNVRGTYACIQKCLPHLELGENPHILTISPPLNMEPCWFTGHVAYSISKYGMSLCTLGMADEFRSRGIAVNSLWPQTVIATEALRMLDNNIERAHCRKPTIMGDAAHVILTKGRQFTGNFCIDEDVLRDSGVEDLTDYAVDPANADLLLPDLFL